MNDQACPSLPLHYVWAINPSYTAYETVILSHRGLFSFIEIQNLSLTDPLEGYTCKETNKQTIAQLFTLPSERGGDKRSKKWTRKSGENENLGGGEK